MKQKMVAIRIVPEFGFIQCCIVFLERYVQIHLIESTSVCWKGTKEYSFIIFLSIFSMVHAMLKAAYSSQIAIIIQSNVFRTIKHRTLMSTSSWGTALKAHLESYIFTLSKMDQGCHHASLLW